MEEIRFTFVGGMTDNHEMNFYEAGRFQYGAARFIFTLERFRQSGIVVARLATKVKADIRIRAASQGSFVQDVLMVALPVVQNCVVQVSFEALFAYVWDRLFPPSKAKEAAIEFAKQQVAVEQEKTKQEEQKTEQFKTLMQIANEKDVTTQKALDILNKAVDINATLVAENYRLGRDDIVDLRNQAQSELQRQSIINENMGSLSQISLDKERRLVGQLRRSVGEIAFPLRSSANNLQVGTSEKSTRFAYLTPASIKDITEETIDENETILHGRIKVYDIESSYGKFRYDEHKRPVPFQISATIRQKLRAKILDAMKSNEVPILAYVIRDRYGNMTSLQIENILEEEPVDKMHS